jgi:hypothetical protein
VTDRLGLLSIIVAASDASAKSKAKADYVCTGVNDQDVISQAILSLPTAGGRIILTEGNFYMYNTATTSIVSFLAIEGQGRNTIIHRKFFSGRDPDKLDSMIRLNPDKHSEVKNLVIDDESIYEEIATANNADIQCWSADEGVAVGHVVIENVHVINPMGIGNHASGAANCDIFFVISANVDIRNCSVAQGNQGRNVILNPQNRDNINAWIINCSFQGNVRVEGASGFISNNFISSLQIGGSKKMIVTDNILSNIIDNTSNSIVENNL